MRFLVAVMAITLAMSLNGFAQKGRSKAYESKNEAKSTAPVKAPKAGASSSKQLQRIEREKGSKGARSTKKTHATNVKANKDTRNSGINFNGKGGKGSGTSARGGGSLKGRLKEKGKSKQH